MKRNIQKITAIGLAIITSSFSGQILASDFSLPFISAAGLGDLYSGWAASAKDASTAYTNPAGLTRLQNQQVVFSVLGLTGDSKFTGSTRTPPYPFPAPVVQSGSASTNLGAIFPLFYYAKPVAKNLVFGLSANSPFALGTSYPKDSIVRYAATRSQIVVVDLSPSIGFKFNEVFSVGLGFDANRLAFTLNNMIGPPLSTPDSEVQNHLSGWGYGWHGGVLFQVHPATRIGLSFNSMVMFHATGDSEAYTPFTTFRTTNQKSNAALPARAQLSINQEINPRWTVMGTLFYTNWSTFQYLTLKRVMTPFGTTTPVTIPFEYHNTFDYAAGVNFKATEKWLLRAGFEIMTKPSNNRDRSVPDPIGSAKIIGLGAHYQQNAKLGYDVSYAHSFFAQEQINLVTPLTSASGHTNTQTNVFGAQVTWDIV